jgi:archaemetzincin
MLATAPAPAPIALQPLGPVLETEVSFLAEIVTALGGGCAQVLPPLQLPREYYDGSRGQYDADRLLDLLFHCLPDTAMRVVGVLDADMFAAGRTFVFGYAHLRDGMAVYSLARLRQEFYGYPPDGELLRWRTYRAVAHELGHTFGNPHCDDADCVMHPVSHIETLDALSPIYCASCMQRTRRGLQVSPQSAEGRFLRGGAYLRRRQLEQAARAYRDAVALAPGEARYHNDLGVALLSLGQREDARRAFGRATDLASDFPLPYYNLGILCRDEGGVEAAAEYFALGLARDRDPVAAHRYLGRLYEELFDDLERARHHYLAYLQLGGREDEVVARAQALSPSSGGMHCPPHAAGGQEKKG